jgi:exonuclease SbcC
MIISDLTLTNIRSYSSQSIKFQKGISFLKGDIGSGKSSILLAIEFALFGFKRGDLEGHHLLRKGAKTASVSLSFSHLEKTITITRNIKATKQGIVQDNGSLSINGDVEEYSPTQLNAHVFELLGYPKEFLTKDRNLLFRFSTYTPQEQLKEILFTDNDKRLEVIRKLFSIDKYKQLQTSLQVYLKKNREKKLVLQTRCEEKSSIENHIKQLKDKLLEKKKNIDSFEKKKLPFDKEYSKVLEKQEHCEEQERRLQQKLVDFQKKQIVLEEYQKKIHEIEKELEEKSSRFKHTRLEDIQKTINDLSKRLENYNEEKRSLEKKVQDLEKAFLAQETQKQQLERFKALIESNQHSLQELEEQEQKEDPLLLRCKLKDLETQKIKQLLALKRLEKKCSQLEHISLDEISKKRLRIELMLENVSHSISHFSHSSSCELCSSTLSNDLKIKTLSSLQQKQTDLEKELKQVIQQQEDFQLDLQQKDKLIEEVELLKEKIKSLEVEYTYKSKELKQVLEQEQERNKKKELLQKQLRLYQEKIKEIEKEGKTRVLKEEQESIRNSLNELYEKEKKTLIQLEQEKQYLDSFKNYQKEEEEKVLKKEKLLSQCSKKPILEKNILTLTHSLEKISTQKKILSSLCLELQEKRSKIQQEIEKELVLLKEFEKQHEELTKKLDTLLNFEKELSRLVLIETFILEKMIPLSSEIEKTLFLSFYIEFSEIFQSIVSSLIEDTSLDVFLRDDFSIVIEQNGYDIDISNLSGGEKSSLAIAYRLALKYIIEKHISHDSMLHVLLLDEPTDGFSNEQISRLGEILQQSEIEQIILVSHDEKIQGIADHSYYVQKKNHTSLIEKI